jgi:hypothetical protein
VFVSVLARDLASGHVERATLIPLAVLVFLIVMTLGGFIPESRRALGELGRLVDASRAELS